MTTRLKLAALAACIALPGILASDANADHRRHWFFDSYGQYETEANTYYAPKRWQRNRQPGVVYDDEDPDLLYQEGVISERQYRRLLRAERRKARRQRAARRKAEQRKRWRKRQVRYDLAPKASKRKQLANVPLPRARPLTEPFLATRSIARPVETATLSPAPVTIAPVSPKPAKLDDAVETAALTTEPIAPVVAKPVQPAPAKTITKKPTKKPVETAPAKMAVKGYDKKVKGRISCRSAEKIVAGFGFTGIEAKSCEGKSYDFAAQRDGKPFTITLSSASGELTEVKRN